MSPRLGFVRSRGAAADHSRGGNPGPEANFSLLAGLGLYAALGVLGWDLRAGLADAAAPAHGAGHWLGWVSLVVLLVFAVMAGLFESVRQAAGLMVALPFALSGAAWTLFFTKTDFDQPAAIGLLLALPALHRAFPRLEINGEPEWADGLTLRGPVSLPVRLRA